MQAMSLGCPKRPSGVPETTSFSKSLPIMPPVRVPFCVNDTRRNGVDACLDKNFLTLLRPHMMVLRQGLTARHGLPESC